MHAQVLASTEGMSHIEWLKMRRKGIGGSDVAAIAGLSKYKSPMQVYLEKIGEWELSEEQSEAAYWGTIMEDVIAEQFTIYYKQETGQDIKVKRKNSMLRHPRYPFMIANLDRVIIGENAGLECKTASEWFRDKWDGESIPDEYMLQCQHYIEVCGFDYMYIAVLIGGNKFKWKRIDRDQEIIDYIIKIESDFWQMVESRTPPEIDGSIASTNVLKVLYPESVRGSVIDLPDEAKYLIQQYEAYAEEEKMAALKKEEAANKLKEILADNEVGIVGDRKVSWKSVSQFDEEAFKQAHPDLYQQFTVPQFDAKAFQKANKKLYEQFKKPGYRRFTIGVVK